MILDLILIMENAIFIDFLMSTLSCILGVNDIRSWLMTFTELLVCFAEDIYISIYQQEWLLVVLVTCPVAVTKIPNRSRGVLREGVYFGSQFQSITAGKSRQPEPEAAC